MSTMREVVRSLEQQESGEIRRLHCPECGARSFTSVEQLDRHELACGAPTRPAPAETENF
jgi:hypothetical protein